MSKSLPVAGRQMSNETQSSKDKKWKIQVCFFIWYVLTFDIAL
jgi:hypothetical protein